MVRNALYMAWLAFALALAACGRGDPPAYATRGAVATVAPTPTTTGPIFHGLLW